MVTGCLSVWSSRKYLVGSAAVAQGTKVRQASAACPHHGVIDYLKVPMRLALRSTPYKTYNTYVVQRKRKSLGSAGTRLITVDSYYTQLYEVRSLFGVEVSLQMRLWRFMSRRAACKDSISL